MMTNKSLKEILNLHHAMFDGVGEYDIPEILPTTDVNLDGVEPVCVNYMNVCKTHDKSMLHFFINDYAFERLWNNPTKYTAILSKYKYVIAPDFSLYTDHPKAVQIFNHYRKHWLARFYQENSVNIIPCIGWSDDSSFDFAFDGEPVNSVVAISAIGVRRSPDAYKNFLLGFDEMVKRLSPSKIIVFGRDFSLHDRCQIPIIFFDNQQMTNKVKARLVKKK